MNPAKQKIEEAIGRLDQLAYVLNTSLTDEPIKKLREALALIPDWVPFDSEDESTWPESTVYDVTKQGQFCNYTDRSTFNRHKKQWYGGQSDPVIAYRPLPEPYQKEER